MQQGDPLGPLLFCLAIHRHCEQLRSPLSVMYLDDVSVGGSVEDVLHDLDVIIIADSLGLTLNTAKCEIICHDDIVRDNLIVALPGAKIVTPDSAFLLGSPLGCVDSIDASLEEKTQALKLMGSRFQYFSAHDALTLLCHSFAIPKLHYLLRTAPCFLSRKLEEYDFTLCSIMSEITNTLLTLDVKAWAQATLPVRFSGFGVCSAAVLAPSAYLSSSAATADLVDAILPPTHQSLPVPSCDTAIQVWSQGHDNDSLVGASAEKERNWDNIKAIKVAESLLNEASDDIERARLI